MYTEQEAKQVSQDSISFGYDTAKTEAITWMINRIRTLDVMKDTYETFGNKDAASECETRADELFKLFDYLTKD
ncbi:hypothetical protein P4V41_07850 [Fictibacillus nanhaiensis]|uniref:hypothetical protein n=1 Tax=Fictibacillus nanhaiensis TaxID=742169 RepID=UPI002E1AD36C|nr:hypothetical protein [Fictibacillus nanhaiensis]